MLGFVPKLPVSPGEREWVDARLTWLRREFGDVSLHADRPVVLPTNDFFPDDYDGTETTLSPLLYRVCSYMDVAPERVALSVFQDGHDTLRRDAPLLRDVPSAPAGYYRSRPAEEEEITDTDRSVIALKASVLSDPLRTIATLSHELGHVLLLGEGRLSHETPDHEPLTDLLTVFKGMGVFTANSALRFAQHERGWAVQRLGYLPETSFGYALARFAQLRGERNPVWAKSLNTNVGAYFRQSAKFLEAEQMRLGKKQ